MRRPTTVLALALALVPLLGTAALADVEGATIDKTGWWNRANTTTATPAGPVTVPPPPGIPAGDLTAGRTGSEPTALAAVGIQPEEGPGATVESFTLTLREDPDAQANQGAEEAAIVACPIVSFWAGGENGTWETKPEFDCDAASAPGVRDDEGTWTFDLAPIGTLWFDTFGTVRADGVVLVADDGTEGSFQVVWLGGDAIDVELRAQPGAEEDDAFAAPPAPDPPASAGFSSGPGGGGTSIFSPPTIASPPTAPSSPTIGLDPVGDLEDPLVEDDATDEVAGAPLAPSTPRETRAGTLIGNLPPAGVLLVPIALATLVAMSYWLGPAGQPSTIDRRGGVSRALALRARTTQEHRAP